MSDFITFLQFGFRHIVDVSALAEHYLAEAHLEAVSSSRSIVQPKPYDHQVS